MVYIVYFVYSIYIYICIYICFFFTICRLMIQFNSIIRLNSTIEFNSLQVSSTSPQGPPQTVEAAAQGMLRRPSWSESSNWSEPNSVVELNWIVELKYTKMCKIWIMKLWYIIRLFEKLRKYGLLEIDVCMFGLFCIIYHIIYQYTLYWYLQRFNSINSINSIRFAIQRSSTQSAQLNSQLKPPRKADAYKEISRRAQVVNESNWIERTESKWITWLNLRNWIDCLELWIESNCLPIHKQRRRKTNNIKQYILKYVLKHSI